MHCDYTIICRTLDTIDRNPSEIVRLV